MAEPRRAAQTETGDLAGARFLIVEAAFYHDLAEALMAGATAALVQAGVTIERVRVPGSLEIAPAIAICLDAAEREGKPYEGVVALGCVIRGETIHFELVSGESARAIMDLSVAKRIPIGNGILTVNDDAQAWARAALEEADKGGEAARAALTLARLKRRLSAG